MNLINVTRHSLQVSHETLQFENIKFGKLEVIQKVRNECLVGISFIGLLIEKDQRSTIFDQKLVL